MAEKTAYEAIVEAPFSFTIMMIGFLMVIAIAIAAAVMGNDLDPNVVYIVLGVGAFLLLIGLLMFSFFDPVFYFTKGRKILQEQAKKKK